MSPVAWAVVAGGVLLVGWLLASYNRFVSQRQLIESSWSTVDTELKRRYDLIPNLVATVRGYAAHERETLEAVVRARTEALATVGTADEQAGPEHVLVDSLRSLLAVAEAYPELRADRHFLDLQHQLTVTEDRIQAARRLYNGNVRDYNRRVESIPSNLVALLAGARRASYFELDDAARAVPQATA